MKHYRLKWWVIPMLYAIGLALGTWYLVGKI
jgi:hypothetical protein